MSTFRNVDKYRTKEPVTNAVPDSDVILLRDSPDIVKVHGVRYRRANWDKPDAVLHYIQDMINIPKVYIHLKGWHYSIDGPKHLCHVDWCRDGIRCNYKNCKQIHYSVLPWAPNPPIDDRVKFIPTEAERRRWAEWCEADKHKLIDLGYLPNEIRHQLGIIVPYGQQYMFVPYVEGT